ncbi:penicillin-binding protein 2 [Georgenia halophila]|uniref:Penicillin-binding protein 2 n=1 Tax=Georgenia halophila TaxID=620889 RepID=A0ABP8L8W1_9MICO
MSVAGALAHQVRRRIVLILVLTMLFVFGGRLVWVQAVQGATLAREAREDRTRTVTVDAPRGDIVDADGEILATSVERYNVGVNQQLVRTYERTDPDTGQVLATGAAAAAEVLAPLLGRDKAELGAKMVGDSTFVYIATGLTPEEWREINELGIPGVEPERTTERIYPNGTTAGNIVGYVGRDRHGLGGLELSMDEVLTGEDGSITVEIGGTGEVIPTGHREEVPARPGHTVHTSIDRDLQYVAQESIDAAVEQFSAPWGAVVVQEIDTGRVLALADSNSVDPGNYQAWAPEDRGSRAVSSPYEPGSTGKLPTFAIALEQGVVEPATPITAPDTIEMPNGQVFHDNSPHETLDLTVAGALQMSSNTATVQIGDMVEDSDRYHLLREFGFGERTGIRLPGETPGVVHPYKDWDGRTRYATMFGQGLSVSLLQNTNMVATIGNQGVRIDPRIIDGTTDGEGAYTPTEPQSGKQVLDEDAADTLLQMMETVVQEGGTGPQGAVPGYRVAAKTGTAEIPDAAGGLSGRLGSYVGVAPAEDPKVAVGVVVYRGSGPSYGGTVAAPTFSEVMGFALRDMGVPPSTEPVPDLPLETQG